MAEPVVNDASAFEPFLGGGGVRFVVTAGVASALIGIPGVANLSSPNTPNVRVRVVNPLPVSAFVRFNVSASLSGLEVLAGTVEVFSLPFNNVNGVTISGIVESGGGSISACAGKGF